MPDAVLMQFVRALLAVAVMSDTLEMDSITAPVNHANCGPSKVV